MTKGSMCTALATGLIAIGLTACGSSSSSGGKSQSSSGKPTPKAQVIRKGDAICRKYNKQSNQISSSLKFDPAHASPAQLKKAAPALSKQASILRTELNQVAALGPPDKDAATFQKAVSGGKQLAPEFQSAAQAAKQGNVNAFQKAFGKIEHNNSNKFAKQFGFKACGQG